MKLGIIFLLATTLVQDTTAGFNALNKAKYEALMLNTKNSAKITAKHDPDKTSQLLQSQDRGGFPDRLLLPRGWSEGMPMQLFTMVTPVEQESSLKQDDARPARRQIKKCSPAGMAYGFPFDRAIENEQNFRHPNMFFKDVKIYHDEDYLLKNFRAHRQFEKV